MTDRRSRRTTRTLAATVLAVVCMGGVSVPAAAAAPVEGVSGKLRHATKASTTASASPARIATAGPRARVALPAHRAAAVAGASKVTKAARVATGAASRRYDITVPTTLVPNLQAPDLPGTTVPTVPPVTLVPLPPLPTTIPPLATPTVPGSPATPPSSSPATSAPATGTGRTSPARPASTTSAADRARGTSAGDGSVAAPSPSGAAPAGVGGVRLTPVTVGVQGAITGRSLSGGAKLAARTMTFPIGVGVLIALFLLLQSRLDARDPRLAAAPIDADDETIGFQ